MKNRNNADWKRINQFRREQQKRIAAQTVAAPSLLSANAEILRLARQLKSEGDESLNSTDLPEKFKVY